MVLQSCLRESAISLPEEKLDQLTLALFQAADKDGSGAITFDELRDELQQFPGVMENLTIRYSWEARALPASGLDPGLEPGAAPSQRSPHVPFFQGINVCPAGSYCFASIFLHCLFRINSQY